MVNSLDDDVIRWKEPILAGEYFSRGKYFIQIGSSDIEVYVPKIRFRQISENHLLELAKKFFKKVSVHEMENSYLVKFKKPKDYTSSSLDVMITLIENGNHKNG